MIARQLYTNLILASGTTLTSSSEYSGAPLLWLQDESRGLRWRSRTGWNPHALLSDQLVFIDDGTEKTAQLTVGNYSTGALYAAEVTTAMNDVAVTNTYVCTYDSGTAKFTIAVDTGAGTFSLPFETGSDLTRSAHPDLGFASTDLTGETTYTGDAVSYKSREFITADFGAAASVQAGIVLDHNLGSSGTITQQGHTANTASGWATPDVEDELAGNSTVRLVYRAAASKRYWRLLIDDVSTNTLGYSEIGVWFAGSYSDSTKNYQAYGRKWQNLSTLSIAISGAHKRDVRTPRDVYNLSWANITENDRDILRSWIDDGLNVDLFLAFDPSGDPTNIVYGYFVTEPREQPTYGRLWQVDVGFAEALP